MVCALASGCPSYRSSKIVAITGGGVTVAGAGVLVLAEAADRDHASVDALILTVAGWSALVLPGAIAGISGLIGMSMYDD